MLAGGCLCGDLRYEVRAEPYAKGFCHCVACRKASGAPVSAWFSAKLVDFDVVRGEPGRFSSSDHGVRLFCGSCGAQVLFEDSRDPDQIDIAIASLDDPEPVEPSMHLWTSSRIDWVRLDDGLPNYLERSV